MDNITLPDAVFWDWDGTLADSYGFLNESHNYTLKALGFPEFEEGEYGKYFGKPRDILYPLIYKEKSEEAKEIFGKYVIENSHKIKTIDGGDMILDFFHSHQVPMGIVSNKKADLIALEVKHLGWGHYFNIIIGAGDTPVGKPSPEPLLLALDKTGFDAKAQDIWYIGDTENDLACANATGCRAVFLSGHADSSALIAQYSPFISVDNFLQLKEILVAI